MLKKADASCLEINSDDGLTLSACPATGGLRVSLASPHVGAFGETISVDLVMDEVAALAKWLLERVSGSSSSGSK